MKKKIRIIMLALLNLITVNSMIQKAHAQKPDTSGYAHVNGLNLYYEVYGQGKPIVLVHGAYQTIQLCWGTMIPDLMKHRKVIAIDLQGHGRTADISRPFSYKAFASDIAALLKHLNIDKADIMGFSVGGTTAMELAIKHPGVVDKLIVISAPYKYSGWLPAMRNMLQALHPAFLDKTSYRAAHSGIYKDSVAFHKFTSKFIKFDEENFDLGETNIKNIKVPVLLIMGDNDGIDLAHKAEMYQLCGGNVFSDLSGPRPSQLAILPNTGHMNLILQKDKVLEFVNGF